jgi:hypothetical protein
MGFNLAFKGLKLYKTLIRPTMTYGSQTLTVTIKEMNTIRIFDTKIVTKIHEPVKEGEPWRIRADKLKDTFQGQVM